MRFQRVRLRAPAHLLADLRDFYDSIDTGETELEKLGLDLWDGTLEEGRLAFMGERGRTLILAPPGRGWMPTGRPSAPHPVEAELSGPPAGAVELEGGLYRVVRS